MGGPSSRDVGQGVVPVGEEAVEAVAAQCVLAGLLSLLRGQFRLGQQLAQSEPGMNPPPGLLYGVVVDVVLFACFRVLGSVEIT